MIDDLISRLRARTTDDGLGDPGDANINPDGPEAAEALILLRDALSEAGFLCDRLRELECCILDDEVGRQYYGHVAPSRARLDALLVQTKIEKAE